MSDEIIRLAAVGDIALTHDFDRLLEQKGSDYPFEKVKQVLAEQDIVFGNLEAPLSEKGETFPMKCSLRTHPEYLEGLKGGGFTVLSLANNHILDYGDVAFSDTLDYLKQSKIECFGAGKNIEDARHPVIFNLKGIKVGFLGYCDVIIDSPFYASDKIRGIAPLGVNYIQEDIAELKKKVDVVIVSLHWGIENWSYPSPDQTKMAHQVIDFGADLILGHHPHVLQGIEKYKSGVIVYSLGNFIFSDITWSWTNKKGNKVNSSVKLTEKNRETAIFFVELTKQGIHAFNLLPCQISEDLQAVLVEDPALRFRNMDRLSAKISSQNYTTFWRYYVFFRKLRAICVWHFKKLRGAPGFSSRILKQLFSKCRNKLPV